MSALRKACLVHGKSSCITQNSLHPFFGGGFLSFASVEKGGLDEGDVLMHHSK